MKISFHDIDKNLELLVTEWRLLSDSMLDRIRDEFSISHAIEWLRCYTFIMLHVTRPFGTLLIITVQRSVCFSLRLSSLWVGPKLKVHRTVMNVPDAHSDLQCKYLAIIGHMHHYTTMASGRINNQYLRKSWLTCLSFDLIIGFQKLHHSQCSTEIYKAVKGDMSHRTAKATFFNMKKRVHLSVHELHVRLVNERLYLWQGKLSRKTRGFENIKGGESSQFFQSAHTPLFASSSFPEPFLIQRILITHYCLHSLPFLKSV